MNTTITEPTRSAGQDRHDPLVVLIRIEWAPVMIWNVVASHNGSAWYVSGLARSCRWGEILGKIGVRAMDCGPYTVEVRRLL